MDPLAQLSDIHLPADIHSYPIAPGWWVLAGVCLALLIYGALKLRRSILKNKAKKAALKQLSSTTEVGAIIALLKWAALQYFPRQQVANLTGSNFKAFLVASLPIKHQQKFSELSGEHFTQVYHHEAASKTSAELSAATKLWLSHALPPIPESPAVVESPALTKNALSPNAEIDSEVMTKEKRLEQTDENNGVKP